LKAAFNNVAALVILGIECWRPTSGAASAFAVGNLVIRLWDHRGDAPTAQ
jgi:hypothetical protein